MFLGELPGARVCGHTRACRRMRACRRLRAHRRVRALPIPVPAPHSGHPPTVMPCAPRSVIPAPLPVIPAQAGTAHAGTTHPHTPTPPRTLFPNSSLPPFRGEARWGVGGNEPRTKPRSQHRPSPRHSRHPPTVMPAPRSVIPAPLPVIPAQAGTARVGGAEGVRGLFFFGVFGGDWAASLSGRGVRRCSGLFRFVRICSGLFGVCRRG